MAMAMAMARKKAGRTTTMEDWTQRCYYCYWSNRVLLVDTDSYEILLICVVFVLDPGLFSTEDRSSRVS